MNQNIVELFKANQIKNTTQRRRVIEYLIACKEPVTAESIYIALFEDDAYEDKVNLSTVYRILDLFVKQSIVLRNSFGNEHKSTYEFNRREHKHHLICVKCNKVTSIKGCPLKAYEQDLGNQTHFKILEHRLEIFGVCPSCQERGN
jgi:Fur family ferric uptake transcriptional regulator